MKIFAQIDENGKEIEKFYVNDGGRKYQTYGMLPLSNPNGYYDKIKIGQLVKFIGLTYLKRIK
jgi:hypothetical protein